MFNPDHNLATSFLPPLSSHSSEEESQNHLKVPCINNEESPSNVPREYQRSSYFFSLPENLIAQKRSKKPLEDKLLVYSRSKKTITHDVCKNLHTYLPPSSCIVRNVSKVFPARIRVLKGKAQWEIVLMRPIEQHTWNCIAHPGRRLKPGKTCEFHGVIGEIISVEPDGSRNIRFSQDILPILSAHGEIPLPSYIQSRVELASYQNDYAQSGFSAACPTAGLHFPQAYFDILQKQGHTVLDTVLNVGAGTFTPLFEEDIRLHRMHYESYNIEKTTQEYIQQTERPIIAIGTTSLRLIESLQHKETSGITNLFITPGYQYRYTTGLITNFHTPYSTLLVIVASLIGVDELHRVYNEAIQKQYAFYSFGDAMAILP